jgi:hypothetical protein
MLESLNSRQRETQVKAGSYIMVLERSIIGTKYPFEGYQIRLHIN